MLTRKSDHELVVNDNIKEERREKYKNGRYNCGKADFVRLRKNFAETNRSSFHATRNIQKKWDEFIQIYTEGIDRYNPKMVVREKKKN